jgi:hypothetical protein
MSNFPEQIRLLALLVVRPSAAMSDILDRGSLLAASLAALAAGFALRPFGFSLYTPLLILAVAYVPGVLLIASRRCRWQSRRAWSRPRRLSWPPRAGSTSPS